MIVALIPAGGKSTRMGRPKLALPLGGRTVLEHVIAALRGGGVDQVVVVLGPHISELVPVVLGAGAASCLLHEETPDMRATVEVGLHYIEMTFHPEPDDDWLLVPADHPTLDPAIVRQLIQARQVNPEKTIVIPTHQSQRGHPTLIRWSHVANIRVHPAGQGLNTYLRQRTPETLEVPVASADILCDLDTPEDYEALRQKWKDT